MSDTDLKQDELAVLKERADKLGVKYHPSIGLDTLRAKVNEAMGDTPPVVNTPPVATGAAPVDGATSGVFQPAHETEGQKRKRMKTQANELVRIRLTCMNPAKKEWPGEIITTGNATVGTIKKFIPYTIGDEGYHVPRMLLEQLQARQCQVFVTTKVKNGVAVRKGKLIKEYAIDILPPLTQEELDELARVQAMAGGVE